jgi:hypothetical protein
VDSFFANIVVSSLISMATWTDENTRIVCEIFAEQVLIGNRSSTHLNKAGFTNVIEKFKERTNILYTKKQFKNKWEKLKVEYGIWKQLVDKQTGIGWDESGQNIDMPEEWWKKMANVSLNNFFAQGGHYVFDRKAR